MSEVWSKSAIKDLVETADRWEHLEPGRQYRQIGVRLWGDGAYERESIDSSQTKYKTLNKTELGDIIVNKIWARNGSVSVVTEGLQNCYCSGEFPLFSPIKKLLEPGWFYWITKTRWFWIECDKESFGSSGKNRIKPENFLQIEIPLPPLPEQMRIVKKLESLDSKNLQALSLIDNVRQQSWSMLRSTFQRIIKNAPIAKMADIAPITRRPLEVIPGNKYPELGVRSFGKGTFHKPSLDYISVGAKRLYQLETGDLLFSNVFAWEGAIAVAREDDHGRVGSHRFIACVPKPKVATSDFLCFYFLTPNGLAKIGEASPGGAGRNRTLGLKKLEQIEVPIPHYEEQLKFDALQKKVRQINYTHELTRKKLTALSASVLDKAFKGEL